MKLFKIFSVVLLLAAVSLNTAAQVTRVNADDKKKVEDRSGLNITERQKSFYEVNEPSDADLQWMKVVYRSLDLTKGKNPALYYPDEPNEDGEDLFFIIMRLLCNGQVDAYEYLDGREMFTDEYKLKVRDILDRFHIYYAEAKGSTEKSPKFTIENADVPANEILSYYIIEKWEFDTRSNRMRARVDALCPVLHRQDEFGGEAMKYPMFWVKLNDIRPYLAQQYVFTDDDNNLLRYNLDDFFKLNMYSGDIYKVKNLRNLSLMQLYPDPDKLKLARDSIEARLRAFDNNLWVPTREELQARKKAREGIEAEGDTVLVDADGNIEPENDNKKSAKRSTKRGAKKTSNDNKPKASNTKVKTRKPKASSSSSNSSATRSVRNRKR